MNLYASGEDFLEAILVLYKKFGSVRSVDIARHMEVSKPSVCHAVNILKEGFLTIDENHFLYLTSQGKVVAEKIYERHRFFTEELIEAGVDPRQAETDPGEESLEMAKNLCTADSAAREIRKNGMGALVKCMREHLE